METLENTVRTIFKVVKYMEHVVWYKFPQSVYKIAENVTVAAFKNDELCGFLENGVRDFDIIKAVEKSFSSVKSNFDTEWRGNLLSDIEGRYRI